MPWFSGIIFTLGPWSSSRPLQTTSFCSRVLKVKPRFLQLHKVLVFPQVGDRGSPLKVTCSTAQPVLRGTGWISRSLALWPFLWLSSTERHNTGWQEGPQRLSAPQLVLQESQTPTQTSTEQWHNTGWQERLAALQLILQETTQTPTQTSTEQWRNTGWQECLAALQLMLCESHQTPTQTSIKIETMGWSDSTPKGIQCPCPIHWCLLIYTEAHQITLSETLIQIKGGVESSVPGTGLIQSRLALAQTIKIKMMKAHKVINLSSLSWLVLCAIQIYLLLSVCSFVCPSIHLWIDAPL